MKKIKIKWNKKGKRISAAASKKELGFLTYFYPDDTAGKRNVEINYLYVKPAYRRCGIATKLLKFFLDKFKNVTWVSFWTAESSEKDKSYPLYHKLGFKDVYYQPDYYRKGVGTRLFVKRMKNNFSLWIKDQKRPLFLPIENLLKQNFIPF